MRLGLLGLLLSLSLWVCGCKGPTATATVVPATSPVEESDATTLTVRADCGGAARCYESIATAMAVARPGETVLVAAGSYRETVTFGQPDVTLRGSGVPEYRAGALVGGTLIVGSINCAGQPGASVLDLGVSASPSSADAITSGPPRSEGVVRQRFANLALLGGGFDARSHALLCQSGAQVEVRDVRMYAWYHGLALKCNDANVSGVYGYQCAGNTIIVKSDKGTGDAARIDIRDVTIEGEPRGQLWGGGVHIQSAADGATTRDVHIQDVTARHAVRGAILIDRLRDQGAIEAITVTHVVSENACASDDSADYDVSGATDVLLEDCRSVASRGYGFRARDGARVAVVAGEVEGAGAGDHDCEAGSFTRLEINGQSLLP